MDLKLILKNFIRNTKEKHKKNLKIIFAIYSTKNNDNNDIIIQQKWYKYLINHPKYKCYFVYANPYLESDFTTYVDYKNRNILEVKCQEKYDKLSIKTHHMIKAFINLGIFDYFIKMDSTLINYVNSDFETDLKDSFKEQIYSFIRKKKCVGKDYYGFYLNYCNFQNAKRWINIKSKEHNKPVDFEYFNSIFNKDFEYYSGKFYTLSYQNCVKVANNISESYLFAEKILGIEDIYVKKSISK